MIIAMWSGPRNLSTALMRSFAQRADCQCWDEPFYAAYLKATGLPHPMAAEVIADGVADASEVSALCVAEPQFPKTIFYQKHMTHHMLEGIALDWTTQITNAFLIREPERVLASYVKKHEDVGAEDIGFRMQRELFEREAGRTGTTPAVIDSADIRRDPKTALRGLCAALGIAFDPAMLSWKKGPAPEDGVWGKHWYDAIWNSTGFALPEDVATPPLPAHLARIADQVRSDYEILSRHKITV